MYPTEFPRSQWYVAARSEEITRELFSRWILDDPICFYRKLDGAPVAMVDRCIHRQMPLSKGRLREDALECGYHGILYGDDGRALRIPSQDHVPPACRVHRYPLVESGGAIWIWMGDPEDADESLIPDHRWMSDPEWVTVGGILPMKARAQLLNENLLDLSHLTFLHPESIGTDKLAEVPVTSEFDENSVRVSRVMNGIDSPPFFTKVMKLSGLIDRTQVAEFTAPAFHVTHVSAQPVDADGDDGLRQHKAIHAVTPERRTSTHYFWFVARDYEVDDQEVSDLWTHGGKTVFSQDVDACEAIEEIIGSYEPSYPVELNMKVDAGPLRARRIVERMVADEAAAPREQGS
ncbi:aromatic ring-hydroxylating dioxygenase subunit alpha [Pseudonocardia kunmingensis]|uniref:Vanillate demethylase subunit A n=1 Tax=Pseudonocardia kunmingensis TaxID=630975 RepID=A0A543CWZ7_9PSEU|nr:aromatic ring-hydroxylating dioxygenase subunit alpha [Pseudonocardia kunmingensis]TQM01637.1 vanillate demethylase subunit A [Pseudonocardia kunmingensis]